MKTFNHRTSRLRVLGMAFLVSGGFGSPLFGGEPGVAQEERLKDLAVIAELVKQLGDASFAKREEAQRELLKAGREAFEPLEKARAADDKELKERAAKILDTIRKKVVDAAVAKLQANGAAFGGGTKYGPNEVTFHNNHYKITDESLEPLRDIYDLRRVTIQHTEVTDKGLKILGEVKTIISLHFSETPAITDHGFEHLSDLPLVSIMIADAPITGTGFKYLRTKNMRGIYITSSELNSDGVTALAGFKQLTRLDISRGKSVSAEALSHLRNLASLEECYLRFDSGIDDEGFKEIGQFSDTLMLLDANCSSNLKGTGFGSMSRLNKLYTLRLFGLKVSAEAAKQLGAIPNLVRLYIHDSTIDSDAIAPLARMQKLRELAIDKTPVTVDDQRYLKTNMPKADISVKPD